MDAKQNALTFDNVPTALSSNPVKSGGVYSALNVKQDTLYDSASTIPSGKSANIKTINGNSILGSGNITIEGGGSQVQANWNESDSTSAAYIQNKPTIPTVPTNVSSFTNDANYLKFQLCADEAAYNAIPTKDSGTLYLIPES